MNLENKHDSEIVSMILDDAEKFKSGIDIDTIDHEDHAALLFEAAERIENLLDSLQSIGA